jgi:hypothetical protein
LVFAFVGLCRAKTNISTKFYKHERLVRDCKCMMEVLRKGYGVWNWLGIKGKRKENKDIGKEESSVLSK